MPRLLVVDDDPKLLAMLRRTLIYEGFQVATAADGEQALAELRTQRPDVLVLDWMMPRMDGVTLLRRLRAEGDKTLVLMLTARDAVENRVEGLDTGADDYLVKPFAPAELIARIHALLRRAVAAPLEQTLEFGDLCLEPGTRLTRRGTRPFELTTKEFDLLFYFMRHPRQVLRREQILEAIWGYDFGGDDNVLDVYIGYLRKKMEAAGEPRLLHTVRAVGYVLRED